MKPRQSTIALRERIHALLGQASPDGLTVRDLMERHAAHFPDEKRSAYSAVSSAIDALIEEGKVKVAVEGSGSLPAFFKVDGRKKWPKLPAMASYEVHPDSRMLPPKHFMSRCATTPNGLETLLAVKRNGHAPQDSTATIVAKLRRIADFLEQVDSIAL